MSNAPALILTTLLILLVSAVVASTWNWLMGPR